MAVDVRQSFWRPVWNGYIFWTLFTNLPALIWFYPLNSLEITYYEVFILILLLPFLLRWRRAMEYLQRDSGDFLLKILCVIGVASFRSATTLQRLCLLTVGTGGAVLKFVCDLTTPDIGKRKFAFWGYAVGFMALLGTRVWYRSITPAFNDESTNSLVILVTFLNIMATIVSFELFTKQQPLTDAKQKNPSRSHSANFILVSFGTGSVFFVLHSIFGEVSTPCRWINGPIPIDAGPQPLPWGLAIYFALLIGFWLSPNQRLVFHPSWSISAAIALFIMYTALGWGGFVAAIFLAVYITSVWPAYMDLLFRGLPSNTVGPAFALAMVVYIAEALFSVWTVAYNFVPLGEYTREATGWLIAITSSFIGLGLYCHTPKQAAKQRHLAFTNAANASKVSRSRVWSRLVYLAILTSSATIYRSNGWNPGYPPADSNRNNFTALIWTYHFGYDNRGWPSLDQTTKVIKTLQADVVGLLETDASRLYMGNNDLAQYLAETLDMYVDYGPNTRRHTWGSMLLSRFPILRSEHHLLPSPKGELAPAISAVLNVSGVQVGVVVTHFGNDIDALDRKLQGLAIAEITSQFYDKQIPVVFLGYVTSKPYTGDYYALVDNGRMKDIDESDTNRFCEYIFYNRLHRLAYARISHGGLSDTEIQAAKFMIPDAKTRNSNNFQDRYNEITTDVSKIPSNQRFPGAFGGFYNGHYKGDTHHYHMFTPKYFRPSK